jgi:hypothetical protein
MQMDNTSILIFVFTTIYWLYLLDPFKSKPQTRRYKKIINDKKILFINTCICLLLVGIGLTRIMELHKGDFILLTPFLFLIFVLGLNFVSKAIYARDFHLIMRGDMLKTSVFDAIASILAIIAPFVLSLILTIVMLK